MKKKNNVRVPSCSR